MAGSGHLLWRVAGDAKVLVFIRRPSNDMHVANANHPTYLIIRDPRPAVSTQELSEWTQSQYESNLLSQYLLAAVITCPGDYPVPTDVIYISLGTVECELTRVSKISCNIMPPRYKWSAVQMTLPVHSMPDVTIRC